jgi:low temperature requirement protein LtrA
VNVVAALRGASGEWVINPVHFAERHTLFVIISLGEAVIAIGATASGIGLDGTTFVGLVAGSAVACVLWWVYFAFTPGVTEHTLRHAATIRRGTVARDLFTFGHFPIVTGILGYAVVVKHMVHDPVAPLSLADRWLLIAGMALFIGGCLNIQWHVIHRLAPERFVAIAVIAAWLLIADSLAGWIAVGAIAVVLAVMQAITWKRFSTGDLATVAEVR